MSTLRIEMIAVTNSCALEGYCRFIMVWKHITYREWNIPSTCTRLADRKKFMVAWVAITVFIESVITCLFFANT